MNSSVFLSSDYWFNHQHWSIWNDWLISDFWPGDLWWENIYWSQQFHFSHLHENIRTKRFLLELHDFRTKSWLIRLIDYFSVFSSVWIHEEKQQRHKSLHQFKNSNTKQQNDQREINISASLFTNIRIQQK